MTRRIEAGRGRELPPVSFAGDGAKRRPPGGTRRAAARVAVALVALTAGLAGARVAHAAPVPDSTRLYQLRAACRPWNRVRVVASGTAYFFSSPVFDETGVLREKPQRRPALLMPPDRAAAPPSRTIAWADIERIDGARSHAGKGFTEGAVVGTMLGATAAFLTLQTDDGDVASGAPFGFLPLGFVFGGLIGASIGGRGSHWTPLYP